MNKIVSTPTPENTLFEGLSEPIKSKVLASATSTAARIQALENIFSNSILDRLNIGNTELKEVLNDLSKLKFGLRDLAKTLWVNSILSSFNIDLKMLKGTSKDITKLRSEMATLIFDKLKFKPSLDLGNCPALVAAGVYVSFGALFSYTHVDPGVKQYAAEALDNLGISPAH